jgi:hypothetical protein
MNADIARRFNLCEYAVQMNTRHSKASCMQKVKGKECHAAIMLTTCTADLSVST